MRTIVDLPDNQLAALDRLSKANRISRAELIRRALGHYLNDHLPDRDAAFGAWKRAGVRRDALAYQRRLRREWGR